MSLIEKIILKDTLMIRRCTVVTSSILPLINNIRIPKHSEFVKEHKSGRTQYYVDESCIGGMYARKRIDKDTFEFLCEEAIKDGNEIIKNTIQ